jgi:hypothetical protein
MNLFPSPPGIDPHSQIEEVTLDSFCGARSEYREGHHRFPREINEPSKIEGQILCIDPGTMNRIDVP